MEESLIVPTCTAFIRAFLETYEETEEDVAKDWNTPYLPSKSKYHYEIPGIWTYN